MKDIHVINQISLVYMFGRYQYCYSKYGNFTHGTFILISHNEYVVRNNKNTYFNTVALDQ